MDLWEAVRSSRRQLNVGKEMAAARLSAALSMTNILDYGRPQQRDDKGWTVLHLAARHSKPQTVRLLIKQGARVTDKDKEGNTPLHLAAESGNREAVRILLHEGARLSERNLQGFSALHLAAKGGRDDVVQLLLQQIEVSVDQKTSTGGRTALHLAAGQGAVGVARALLAAGADARYKASLGWTPLHFSCREGKLEVTRVLLENGARVDAVTTGAWTSLMFAAAHNHVAVVQLLIEKRADRTLKNGDGLTAEAIAAGKGFTSMVALLRGQLSTSPQQPANQGGGEDQLITAARGDQLTSVVTVRPALRRGQTEPAATTAAPESGHRQAEEAGQLRQPERPPAAVMAPEAESLEKRIALASEEEDVVSSTEDVVSSTEDEDSPEDDDDERLQTLKQHLSTKMAELRRTREENLQILCQKEQEINRITASLDTARHLEERLRCELEQAKKEARELTVQEAVAKNAFEKISNTGQDKVKQLEKQSAGLRKEILLYKQQRSSGPPTRLNPSKSVEAGLNIEAELECPICFELSRPPIYQCPEGHIICSECRPRVTRCPVCRFVFLGTPDIRNRFVERLSLSYFNQTAADQHNITY